MTKFEYYAGREDVQYFPEAATQSYKKGQFVYLVAGKLTECAANSVAILGIALQDATTTTNTWQPVLLAHSTTRFVGTTSNAGADVTVDITMLCVDCELYEADNAVTVDIGTTGGGVNSLHVVALHPDHIPVSATATVTDATNAKVIFKVIDAISQATDLAM